MLKIWKSVKIISEFQIRVEEKKLDLLRKEQKSAHIAIKQTCIDVWNLMKKESFPNDWIKLTSREQTLIAEVDIACFTQSCLTEERMSQENEMAQMATENMDQLSENTYSLCVFDSPQFVNDYSQLMDSIERLLLCGTGPCVKVRFIPDSMPEKRIALGHILVIDEDILDNCNEVGEAQINKNNVEHLSKEQDNVGKENECDSADSGIHGSASTDDGFKEKQAFSSSVEQLEINKTSDEYDKEKHTHTVGSDEVCKTVADGTDSPHKNTKETQSVGSEETSLSTVRLAAGDTNLCHNNNRLIPDESENTGVCEINRYEENGNILDTSARNKLPEETISGVVQNSSYSNITSMLPMSYLRLMSDVLSVTPITPCSSSTKLWSNLDEHCAARVHIDVEDPNPGDLELFCVDDSSVVVLVDPHNKSIKSFPDPDTCHRIELNHSPVRITKIDEGKCAVTFKSANCICLLNVTPALELTRVLQTRKAYNSISYIAYSSQFVCCEAKHTKTLDVLNTIGQVVRKINLPTIDNTLCEPYYLKAMTSDNILICDVILRALFCISQSGDVIFTYSPEAILLPVGVCCDENNNIFLADAKESRVIFLSKEGKMLGHVISERDGLVEPWAIRFDENSRRFCVIMRRSEFKWFDHTLLQFKQFQQEKIGK